MVKGFGKILVIALLGFCFALPADASLTSDINAIVTSKSQKNAHFTVRVVTAPTGRAVYTRCADELMIPASNMKIITSAAAIHYLGPGYEFTTKVGLRGRTLIVIGGGDPLLGDPDTDEKHGRKPGWLFADIAKALKERSVKSLDEIIIDTAFFDKNGVCPNWSANDLNQDYACEVSGLNYNLNCIKVSAKRSGSRAIIYVEPQTKYFSFSNKMKLLSKGQSVIGVMHNAQPNKLLVSGKCAPGNGASADVAIKKPAGFFGVLLAENLSRAGIRVPKQVTQRYTATEKGVKIIRAYETPMADVLERCNTDSLNLAAEAFVKTISAENTTGRINGEWHHGQALVARYLRTLGCKDSEFVLDDGSGLSRKNKLTANVITKVLLARYNSPNRKLFTDSLAVGGQTGTIGKYFKEPAYKGNVIGKTGYISGVRTFSGLCKTPQGVYIFSILTSGGSPSTRTAINDIAKAIIKNNAL
ncbi:MAG: D-alanyl-D-alanine carboxypeptidase/D-alanyl-D-alanine-endopeptidase [Planctomycetes bacterium]|nr:D-alanyl-D-alanine carboxypeptidase/D-alanyl-D-alanine-endopeptidase [Planctomycetota bacterium]